MERKKKERKNFERLFEFLPSLDMQILALSAQLQNKRYSLGYTCLSCNKMNKLQQKKVGTASVINEHTLIKLILLFFPLVYTFF